MKIESMVKLLLENNADINAIDKDNKKPSDYGNAILFCNFIVNFFFTKGLNTNNTIKRKESRLKFLKFRFSCIKGADETD